MKPTRLCPFCFNPLADNQTLLEEENDKLREERDMYRDLVGCMVHPDVPDQLQAENEKLRELVLDMWCAMWECNQYTCKHGEEGCYTKNGDNGGKCVLRDRMRELGVEV